jgi:hypothetical protein
MVTVEAWNDNGLEDIRVVGVKEGFYIQKKDFDKIQESLKEYEEFLKECNEYNLLNSNWYQFELNQERSNNIPTLNNEDYWYSVTKSKLIQN